MTGPVHKWPADKLATMAKLRRMGVPVEDIATRYGISKRRVRELLADTARLPNPARLETECGFSPCAPSHLSDDGMALIPPHSTRRGRAKIRFTGPCAPSHLSLRSHDPAPESEYQEGTWPR